MGEPGHVDAAGGNVRGHQHAAFTGFEAVERCLPGVLGLVPMNAGSLDPLALQVPDDTVHTVLRAGKDQGTFNLRIRQELREQVFFVDLIHIIEALIDGLDGGGDGIDLDVFRIHKQVEGQFLHFRRHGCGKEKGLALIRKATDDLPHVVDEPHIEHAISFVQDEDLDPVQPY